MAYVNLSKLPDPKELGSVTISGLHGGLNLRSDPTEVGAAQSPDMLNMWYQDGVLRKRPGQKTVRAAGSGAYVVPGIRWFYDKLFGGKMLCQEGSIFNWFDPANPAEAHEIDDLLSDLEHGTFFSFGEYVFYKGRNAYIRFALTEDGGIEAEPILLDGRVSDSVYTPVIAINRKPDGAGGDSYQPENRINPRKWVWFDIDDTSRDYYLPVHGAEVLKVQIGDDVIDTSTEKCFVKDGLGCEILGEDLPEDSTEYTRLRFSMPVYADETGWSSTDWTGTASRGGNYFTNVVWSGLDVGYLDGDYKAALKNGDLIFGSTGDKALREEFTRNMIDMAFARSGFEEYKSVFVLDNGTYMNAFFQVDAPGIVNEDGTVSFVSYSHCIKDYNPETDEILVQGMVMVSYSYAKGTWSTKDYTRTPSTGWNYAGNCVYASRDFSSSTNKGAIILPAGGIAEADMETDPDGYEKYERSFRATHNLVSYAEELLLQYGRAEGFDFTYSDGVIDAPLLFISENDDIYVFRYKMPGKEFWITEYDKSTGYFKARNYLSITIQKADHHNVQFGAVYEAGKYGMYTKNIVWCSEDMYYYNGTEPDYVLKASEGELPEEYAEQVQLALRRAMRDYPEANITLDSPVIISRKDPYLTIYIPGAEGMHVTEYDVKTGEFKAIGWVSEGYNGDKDVQVGVSFTTPAILSNQVRVLYSKENPEAMEAIASCRTATSYGGSGGMCVVMGGCEKQPNAIFWSGNGSYGVDPTYFPMDQYNLCGVYQDPVTGFGKQQSNLIVFQENHMSRASISIETINGRSYIDLPVVTINSENGCDRPWSIRLCGNNLVWLHSRYGAMYLKDATSAYENMVITISDNVNGSDRRPGLLKDIAEAETVFALDDGKRYMAFLGDRMYCWDHAISSVSEDGVYGLSWTRHEGIRAETAFDTGDGRLLLMDEYGAIREFSEAYTDDDGEKIPCHYTTATQSFGGYYRKRNVREIILTASSDKGGSFTVRCGSERAVPLSNELNTAVRPMWPSTIVKREFPTPFVYKPRLFGISHLWVRVESDGSDGGLAIDGMTILYTSHGKVR